MELDFAIKDRHSVRDFTNKKPDWREIIECIDSARYAPMAGNNFTLRFVLVSDLEKIKKLTQAAQQDFIQNCQYIVVICSDKKRIINAFEERGEKYAKQQAGAGIQNILLSLTKKGLATCWIGHFVEDQIKSTLGIPDNIDVEAMLPIGYEKKLKQPKKQKADLDQCLFFDKYKNKRMQNIKHVNT
jgi:nitroreductase